MSLKLSQCFNLPLSRSLPLSLSLSLSVPPSLYPSLSVPLSLPLVFFLSPSLFSRSLFLCFFLSFCLSFFFVLCAFRSHAIQVFGFFDFSENVDFGFLPVGFWVWEGVQAIDASCGIQINGFSARAKPYASFLNDFHDLGVFASVFVLLTHPPGGPVTTCECPKPDWSGSRNSSTLDIQNPA